MTRSSLNLEFTIHKVARINDKATNTYVELLNFPVSENENGTLELAPSIVNDLTLFEKRLRDAGATLPKDKDKLDQLLVAVANSDAPEERVYEVHTGWIEEKSAFVMIDGIVGVAPSKIVGIKGLNVTDNESGKLSVSGTWKAWRDSVATLTRLSSIMMFAICVAFAAPLLAFLNWPSFAICLFARTRVGKSVATLMAASVPGIGRLEDLMTWNITDARLEQRLAEYNDCIFAIDDLLAMVGSHLQKYSRARDLAYKLGQGWAVGRHDSFTRAHGGVQEHWRTILLTSYEKSIRDFARAVKLERQHGEALRLIDVPAILGGLDHIFDRLPADLEIGNFHDWKKDTFKKITDACNQNHGMVFNKYIKTLITCPSVEKYTRAKIAYFVNEVCDQFDGDVARDVAAKFGLIYAGGRLGIRRGLLPWDKDELLEAITKCYFGARDLLPDDGVARREGIVALRIRLRELLEISKSKPKNIQADFEKIDGYRQRQRSFIRYIIKREVFNAVFASSTQKTLVIDWLIENQRITLTVPIASAGAVELKPKGQFIWPDGVRRRSYEILWPRRGRASKAAARKKGK
jgi:Domain of unknown function (DUF927)